MYQISSCVSFFFSFFLHTFCFLFFEHHFFSCAFVCLCSNPQNLLLGGDEFDPSQAPAHYKGLSNKNVQSTSFKLLQRALETNNNNYDDDSALSDPQQSECPTLLFHSSAKAPKIKGTKSEEETIGQFCSCKINLMLNLTVKCLPILS